MTKQGTTTRLEWEYRRVTERMDLEQLRDLHAQVWRRARHGASGDAGVPGAVRQRAVPDTDCA